jgi:hypothetical protein
MTHAGVSLWIARHNSARIPAAQADIDYWNYWRLETLAEAIGMAPNSRWTMSLVAAIVVVGTSPAVESFAQPYYYQPPPSYYRNDTVADTFVGGALGAITGAVVGGRSHRGEGALIGAGVGAITGNLIGQSKDRADQRHAAAGAAVVANANQQVAAMAVTNYDLISMTRAGVGDDLIISTMQSRGARLDLSPNGLIALKQAGVSDRVLMSAQNLGAGPAYVAAPPSAVIVTPGPPPYWYGPRPYYRSHIYYRVR